MSPQEISSAIAVVISCADDAPGKIYRRDRPTPDHLGSVHQPQRYGSGGVAPHEIGVAVSVEITLLLGRLYIGPDGGTCAAARFDIRSGHLPVVVDVNVDAPI